MVRFIDLEKGDKLYAINLENKKLKLFVIEETPYYIDDFGCSKALILPILFNGKFSVIIINLDKIKQSISFEEDTNRFIYIYFRQKSIKTFYKTLEIKSLFGFLLSTKKKEPDFAGLLRIKSWQLLIGFLYMSSSYLRF